MIPTGILTATQAAQLAERILHAAIKEATGEEWDNPIPPWHRVNP